ncbi:cryptochrome/photolyase family protein [Niveibacterium terrae]|uniref:cryptochrome/photolyase family protein n=1 Tax=Niveibacterium terrae TaxID=3373598 RepID=UPI003A92C8A6
MGALADSALVWFRRDLRDTDHAALHHALKSHRRVFCAFVFDTAILDELADRGDRRLSFIHGSIEELNRALRRRGGALIVRHGDAREEIPRLALELGVAAVHANADYEPFALRRDDAVSGALGALGIAFRAWKDQLIFEKDEILSGAGKPYSVFTPYSRAWLKELKAADLEARPVEGLPGTLAAPPSLPAIPSLAALGFTKSPVLLPCGISGARQLWADFQNRIADYARTRDFPALKGVSYLSAHLRFGTLSIRELVRFAAGQKNEGAETWLKELIWREFYQQILWHRPEIETLSFKPEFDAIEWESGAQANDHFAAWCAGRTGYPLVDAAMRQLAASGWMHNRLRMIVASFLTKDLGLHWLRGERFFAAQLLDFDLASNNGGWQWAASTGCDAQPWFRIFNPIAQSQKFDPEGNFIRRYVPELAGVPAPQIHAPWLMSPQQMAATGCVIGHNYPAPVVDHAAARARTLTRFEQLRRADLHPAPL